MSTFQRFFSYQQRLDWRDETLLAKESRLYLFASTLSRKPLKMITIGIGNADAALTLLFAAREYAAECLVCVQPAKTETELAPHLKEQLEKGGAQVITEVDLEVGDHPLLLSGYDLVAVDLSKINTTKHLPKILSLGRDRTQLFLYTSVAVGKKAILAAATNLLPPSEWCIDVVTRQKESHSAPAPDMLAVSSYTRLDGRAELLEESANSSECRQEVVSPIHLALPPPANNFGWGICSRYLSEELAKIRPIHILDTETTTAQRRSLPGKVFHALTGIRFESIFEGVRGEENFAYTFFEDELLPASVENAKRYDLVLGGSTWCLERMQAKGIANSGVLIQGIDPKYFYPIKTPKSQEKFVLFSGGKFEPRKGQDLVLAAFKALQDKYPDIYLVNCWHNLWPQSMDLMAGSKWIRYERKGERWNEIMNHIYALNGIDPQRIFTIDLVPNETQRDLYRKTDLGVFPNRCEGGTNLVLMEYMACAKPVIGAYSTGQRDVLSRQNALLLEDIRPFAVRGPTGDLVANWTEPGLDELIAQIEFAYHHREQIAALGRQAGADLQKLTWAHSATSLLQSMGEDPAS
ncbi:MAG: glycosyltransferase family 4 protein [Desulfosarcinaceae bacterium]|nr:glycosyltransferase family 4 protein [Desulfosarcinaceae bacterium]